MVRSNAKREIGFLSENRRTNVAITRARRFVCLICDSDTVSANPFLKATVEYFEKYGETRSPIEQEYCTTDTTFESFAPSTTSTSKPVVIKKSKQKQKQQKQHKETEEQETQSTTIRRSENELSLLEKRIKEFIEDENQHRLDLPTTLNSFMRMKAHEIAESFGIEHQSHGIGIERHISLIKRNQPSIPTDPNVVVTEEEEEEIIYENEEEEEEEEEEEKTSETVSKTKKQTESKQEKKKQQKAKKPKQSKPKPKISAGMDELDLAIAELDIDNKRCSFRNPKCNTIVDVLGATCRFCRFRYCFKHMQPEIHGCGEAAKKDAQSSSRLQFEQKMAMEKLAPFVLHPKKPHGNQKPESQSHKQASQPKKKKK